MQQVGDGGQREHAQGAAEQQRHALHLAEVQQVGRRALRLDGDRPEPLQPHGQRRYPGGRADAGPEPDQEPVERGELQAGRGQAVQGREGDLGAGPQADGIPERREHRGADHGQLFPPAEAGQRRGEHAPDAGAERGQRPLPEQDLVCATGETARDQYRLQRAASRPPTAASEVT